MGEISQVIYGAAIIIIAAFLAWEKIREMKLTKSAGLKANPERCAIHETKINQLAEEIHQLKEQDEKIIASLDSIRERLARIEAKQ